MSTVSDENKTFVTCITLTLISYIYQEYGHYMSKYLSSQKVSLDPVLFNWGGRSIIGWATFRLEWTGKLGWTGMD